MLKTITVPALPYRSHLGELIFKSVPVMVDAGVSAKDFDAARDSFGLAGDVIGVLEREVAKKWLLDYVEGAPRDLTHLEAYGIALVLGVNATELARILGVTKGTMSKVFKGKLTMNPTAVRLLVRILLDELLERGSTRKLVAGETALVVIPRMAPKPQLNARVALSAAA